ncbi:MAG: hypothetical protein ACKVJG_00030 [Candidatus Latescibacterota bacterium]
MLTGYADRASVSRAFSDAEIHELVSKPWDDEELKQILRNALDQSAGQDGEIPGLHAIINEIESLPPLPHLCQGAASAAQGRSQFPRASCRGHYARSLSGRATVAGS